MGQHFNRKPLGNHERGYCRPPRRQKGDSAKSTRQGPRTFGVRQMMADFFGALEEEIDVVQNGKKSKMPAGKVVYRQLVAKAVKGESWAIRKLTDVHATFLQAYDTEMEGYQEFVKTLEDYVKKTGKPIDPDAAAMLAEFKHRIANYGTELLNPKRGPTASAEAAKPTINDADQLVEPRRYGPL